MARLVEALPTFLGKMHIDMAAALDRARHLRRRLEGAANIGDESTGRGSKEGPQRESEKPAEDSEDNGDEAIGEAIKQSKEADSLLNQLHKAFIGLRPAVASSRALRLMNLLQEYNDFLAVDRESLEALLIAVNHETPPMPEGNELILEHSWCGVWWSRLRGQPQPDIEDAEIELNYVEELQARQERAQREAEEADQDAREIAYQRRLDDLAEQHLEQMRANYAQKQDDAVMQAALGLSQSRPSKRMCIGVCITDGVQTKAWDWELRDGNTLQVHIKAEARTFPGRWYRAGQEISSKDVPDVLKEGESSSSSKTAPSCKPSPYRHYDLNKPATQQLYQRWLNKEVSDQAIVQIADVDMLAFFKAMAEITPDEMDDLAGRDTMDLQPQGATEPACMEAPPCDETACVEAPTCMPTQAEEEVQGPEPGLGEDSEQSRDCSCK